MMAKLGSRHKEVTTKKANRALTSADREHQAWRGGHEQQRDPAEARPDPRVLYAVLWHAARLGEAEVTATELMRFIKQISPRNRKYTPEQVGRRVRALAPLLPNFGVSVEFVRRRDQRTIKITGPRDERRYELVVLIDRWVNFISR